MQALWGGQCQEGASLPHTCSSRSSIMGAHTDVLIPSGKKAKGLLHPLLCLEAIEYGVANGGRAGLQKVGLL